MKAWRWAAVLSFLAALATGWVVFDVLFDPLEENAVSVEVPNLIGSEAASVETADWIDLHVEYRYDANTPSGVVFSQTPMAGSRRKLTADNPQCRIDVVVSLGEETLTLPSVVGRDVRETVSELRSQGFTVETVTQTGGYPVGTVLASEPRAGTEMPKGGKVTLTVSAGTPSETVKVPDLRGLSRSEAPITLWLSQLAVGEVIEVEADAEAGTVVRQSHQAGTVVAAGTRVTLFVSRGIDE